MAYKTLIFDIICVKLEVDNNEVIVINCFRISGL